MILTGAAVLLLWIPLRQMPGLGTVSNVIVLGLAANATLAVLPPLDSLVRVPAAGRRYRTECAGDGMYIGAGLVPGRAMADDRSACSYRGRCAVSAPSIEVSVLLIGWMMGGKFGVGTVLYALTIGPLIQLCLPWFQQPAARKALAKPGEAICSLRRSDS
jgi:uncharacterized membrane protein YczE